MDIKSFNQLKKNLKKDFSELKKIKIAVIGDTATQFYVIALRGYGYEQGLDLQIFEADYDQLDLQILNPDSELYNFDPEFVIIAQASQKLIKSYYKSTRKSLFAENKIAKIQNYVDTINSRLNTKIILFNFASLPDTVFGNYANKIDVSWAYQLRKINFQLMELAIKEDNVFINDIASQQNHIGYEKAFDPQVYIRTDVVNSLDFLPQIAKSTTDIILAIVGKFKKCLILDLDNTTWGGIIGDDGLEKIQVGSLGLGKAFTELQLWAKNLKNRGVILCICSKNTDSVAREPFEKHPDMVLRLEDISVFVANWENKADNIRYIQKILNIGFDSMVFLDDNPFERNLVRSELAEVTVPELPKDPAEYVPFLLTQNFFEMASYSGEDANRTKKYQEEAKRVNLKESFTSLGDFLGSLGMEAEIDAFKDFYVPRIAQLTQRSNQFNLRTIRYTEKDVNDIIKSDEYLTRSVVLKDKFGEYGLISLVILKKQDKALFIDTWIMSCRVLKRGVEYFLLNELVELAKENGSIHLIGERIPTVKNVLVKDHYKDLGFEEKAGLWYLNIETYQPLDNHISSISTTV